MHGDIFDRYGMMFRIGGNDTYLSQGAGVEEPGEVKNKPEVMALAEETAEKLVAQALPIRWEACFAIPNERLK